LIKVVKVFIILFLSGASILIFPIVYKLFGGTFLYGNSVIYKGVEIVPSEEKCSINIQEDFHIVTQVCFNELEEPIKRVWIDGVEKKQQSY